MADLRLTILNKLYGIYDNFVAAYVLTCHRGCSHCCTSDVTLTTLEAVYLLERTPAEQRAQLLTDIEATKNSQRFQPRYTTNQAAHSAMHDQPLPEEPHPLRAGSCPLLTDHVCPIYAQRPFGCRCLLSSEDCGQTGEARMEGLWVTVNTVMLQFIEHLDSRGCSGNFGDVIEAMATNAGQTRWRAGQPECGALNLIPNHPLPMLMVPPEHRALLAPLVEQILTLFRQPA